MLSKNEGTVTKTMATSKILGSMMILAIAMPALAEWRSPWRIDNAKYEQGDCITATDQALSFYGHYAKVKGVLSFSGKADPGVYVLSFPVYSTRTPLFDATIEPRTQRVDGDFCRRQSAQENKS